MGIYTKLCASVVFWGLSDHLFFPFSFFFLQLHKKKKKIMIQTLFTEYMWYFAKLGISIFICSLFIILYFVHLSRCFVSGRVTVRRPGMNHTALLEIQNHQYCDVHQVVLIHYVTYVTWGYLFKKTFSLQLYEI